MRQPIIKIESLSTGYRGRHDCSVISKRINATLFGGELTCLLGPNGSGKSTLLRTLAAFMPPIEGGINIMGHNIKEYSRHELSKLISVVLTQKAELTDITVQELVGLGRNPYTGFWGTLSNRDIEIVEHSLEMTGIVALKSRIVNTLSDGERQKAMIAKALAQQTPIILLDEPTAFLDFPSKVEIMQLLRELSSTTGKTILLSTHDLEIALQLAHTVWLMSDTLGVTTGSPRVLSSQGILQQYFNHKGVVFDSDAGSFRIKPL